VGRGFNSCDACSGAGFTLLSKSRLRQDRSVEFHQDRLACTACFGGGRITCSVCKGVGRILDAEAESGQTQAGKDPS
jgi:DnaJ-class molecular chaperone